MDGTSASPQQMNAQQRSTHIREVVLAEGVRLRQQHPWLLHQDALGAGILAFALLGMMGSAALYITGHMAWWACLLINAFLASLTHELEHDLIHSMYFRKQRIPHNLMMGLVWLARPSTINPWIRRHLHLNHHKVSGTETDMEERAITNGEPWGFARLLMVGDNVMSAFIRLLRAKTWKHKLSILKRSLLVYAPLALLHWGAWYVFLGFHAANGVASLLGAPIEWSATTLQVMQVIDIAADPQATAQWCGDKMPFSKDDLPGQLNAWRGEGGVVTALAFQQHLVTDATGQLSRPRTGRHHDCISQQLLAIAERYRQGALLKARPDSAGLANPNAKSSSDQ